MLRRFGHLSRLCPLSGYCDGRAQNVRGARNVHVTLQGSERHVLFQREMDVQVNWQTEVLDDLQRPSNLQRPSENATYLWILIIYLYTSQKTKLNSDT